MKYLSLMALMFSLSSISMAYSEKDCRPQIRRIVANLISVETGKTVRPTSLHIADLGGTWNVWSSEQGQETAYLLQADEETCKIITLIEAEGEEPVMDFHWEKIN